MVPVMTNWPRSIVRPCAPKAGDEPIDHVERVAEHQRACPFLALDATDEDRDGVGREVEIAPIPEGCAEYRPAVAEEIGDQLRGLIENQPLEPRADDLDGWDQRVDCR